MWYTNLFGRRVYRNVGVDYRKKGIKNWLWALRFQLWLMWMYESERFEEGYIPYPFYYALKKAEDRRRNFHERPTH